MLQQVYIDGKMKRTDLPCRCLLFPSMGLLCGYSSLVVYTQEQSTVTQNNQIPNNLIMTQKNNLCLQKNLQKPYPRRTHISVQGL